jgi:hypothetical protein
MRWRQGNRVQNASRLLVILVHWRARLLPPLPAISRRNVTKTPVCRLCRSSKPMGPRGSERPAGSIPVRFRWPRCAASPLGKTKGLEKPRGLSPTGNPPQSTIRGIATLVSGQGLVHRVERMRPDPDLPQLRHFRQDVLSPASLIRHRVSRRITAFNGRGRCEWQIPGVGCFGTGCSCSCLAFSRALWNRSSITLAWGWLRTWRA